MNNEIQLKNKMDLNNQKITNHPPFPGYNGQIKETPIELNMTQHILAFSIFVC